MSAVEKRESLSRCKPDVLLLPTEWLKYFIEGFTALESLAALEPRSYPYSLLRGSNAGRESEGISRGVFMIQSQAELVAAGREGYH